MPPRYRFSARAAAALATFVMASSHAASEGSATGAKGGGIDGVGSNLERKVLAAERTRLSIAGAGANAPARGSTSCSTRTPAWR